MIKEITLPCSEDQIFMIEEHIFKNVLLEILPSERIRLYELIKKKYPNSKILKAHLDLEKIEWLITLEGADEA
jgi:hypothetical protein